MVKVFYDDFELESFDGSVGSYFWFGFWQEDDIYVGFEEGQVRIVDGVLSFDDVFDSGGLLSVMCMVNLVGVIVVMFSFDFEIILGVDESDEVVVEVLVDGGVIFVFLEEFGDFDGDEFGECIYDVFVYVLVQIVVCFCVVLKFGGLNEFFCVIDFQMFFVLVVEVVLNLMDFVVMEIFGLGFVGVESSFWSGFWMESDFEGGGEGSGSVCIFKEWLWLDDCFDSGFEFGLIWMVLVFVGFWLFMIVFDWKMIKGVDLVDFVGFQVLIDGGQIFMMF